MGAPASAQAEGGEAAAVVKGSDAAVEPGLRFLGVRSGEVADPAARLGARAGEGTTSLSLILEDESGRTLATSSGTASAVLMVGPPEARRPWTAEDVAPGAYTLRARGVHADRGVFADTLAFRVATDRLDGVEGEDGASGDFRVGFREGVASRRAAGDPAAMPLEVLGSLPEGDDLLVLAWDTEAAEMREGFGHLVVEPPYAVEGPALAALAPGELELQVLQRRNGEVISVTRHDLRVERQLELSADAGTASATPEAGATGLLASSAPAAGDTRTSPAPPVADTGAASEANAAPVGGARSITRPAPAGAFRRDGGVDAAAAVEPDAPVTPGLGVPSASPAPVVDAAPDGRVRPTESPEPSPRSAPPAQAAPPTQTQPVARVDPPAPTSPPAVVDPPLRSQPPAVDPKPAAPTPPTGGPEVPSDRDASGFTVFPIAPDARVLYVSSSTGDDLNNGLSPDRAFASFERAKTFLRDGFPDRVLLRAGDTFEGTVGFWGKSGRSKEQPMVVSTFGDGDRPVFRCGDDVGIQSYGPEPIRHVAFQGFELLADKRVPGSPGFTREAAELFPSGVRWLRPGADILFEDLKVTWFGVNLNIQANDGRRRERDESAALERGGGHLLDGVTVRRCIVANAYGIGAHAQGIFTGGITNFLLEESFLDHNGWNEDVPGAKRTLFNHNFYTWFTMDAPMTLRGNVIARGASHGAQVRPGGLVEGNLFNRNALALMVCDAPSVVRDNVFLKSDDISPEPRFHRGIGVEALTTESVEVTRNVFSQKIGQGRHLPAVDVKNHHDDNYHALMNEPNRSARVSGNTVFRWTMANHWRAVEIIDEVGDATVTNNVVEESEEGQGPSTVAFVDPERDVASYLESLGESGGMDRFSELACARPRGVWDSRWAAEAVNAYIRRGFELQSGD